MSDSNPVLISGIIGGIALLATAVTIGYNKYVASNTSNLDNATLELQKSIMQQIQKNKFNHTSNNPVAKPRSQSNSDHLTQLSQPVTVTYECDECKSTFNNRTDFKKHLDEHNFYNSLGIVKGLTPDEQKIRNAHLQQLYRTNLKKHELNSRYATKGGIRKRKRTHKKHHKR